jgi:hypothetical protein
MLEGRVRHSNADRVSVSLQEFRLSRNYVFRVRLRHLRSLLHDLTSLNAASKNLVSRDSFRNYRRR